MTDPYPDYDVLDKRDTPSWNDKTREVVDQRMSLTESSHALDAAQLATLRRLVSRLTPQPEQRAPANTVAIVLQKIDANASDGYRLAGMPQVRECWCKGLDAIREEAIKRHGLPFADLDDETADALLRTIENGETSPEVWTDFSSKQFWTWRILPDVVSAHWSHPSLWSAMGFGGPASPRGYVRLDANRRDGWEAREETDG
ncbi:gluconate 2-dehydrogenase subunit 3 family protein [Novosphingobium malaysiense]|uniref:Gluconate 2-dehydrogenase n=1 Tax=Novosphingobium malaysiense TaxID=1348853 RepID=A0A0B1ZNG8_9SPHN|nr:gluconate 2-dehydrogenase subunit 3 family protein [Novosphingobium malaysiense]KHK90729.1 hypothetical protein LK12_15570 [Novosphingobium malaysiense]